MLEEKYQHFKWLRRVDFGILSGLNYEVEMCCHGLLKPWTKAEKIIYQENLCLFFLKNLQFYWRLTRPWIFLGICKIEHILLQILKSVFTTGKFLSKTFWCYSATLWKIKTSINGGRKMGLNAAFLVIYG